MEKVVLVAAGSAAVRQIIKLALGSAGYNVVEATDYLEALAKLEACKVGLIISDSEIASQSGLSLVQEVEQNPLYKLIPLIMLSNRLAEEKEEKGSDNVINIWVEKPVQPQKMLAVVARLAA